MAEWLEAQAQEHAQGQEQGQEQAVAPVLATFTDPSPPPLLALGRQIQRLFPALATEQAAATGDGEQQESSSSGLSLGVSVGGECRPDKFLVMDRVLETVSSRSLHLSLPMQSL
jgi:hypothetical protein